MAPTRDESGHSRQFNNTLNNQTVVLYNTTTIRGSLPSLLSKFLLTTLFGEAQKGIPHTWWAPQGPGEAKFLYDVGIMFGFLLTLMVQPFLEEEKEQS